VVDRRSGGAETRTRQLRMDPDNLFVAAHRTHVSSLVMRLPQGLYRVINGQFVQQSWTTFFSFFTDNLRVQEPNLNVEQIRTPGRALRNNNRVHYFYTILATHNFTV